jgi:hypothetical protein
MIPMNDDIQVQRLTEARVFIVKGDPDAVILRFTGNAETHYFSLRAADLQGLADRFALDAMLLLAGRDGTAQ